MYTSLNSHNHQWDTTNKTMLLVIHQLDILKTLNSLDILKMLQWDILQCHILTLQVIQMEHILNISHIQLTINIPNNNNNILIHLSHILHNSTLHLDNNILTELNPLKVMVRFQFRRINPQRLKRNRMKKKEHLISLRFNDLDYVFLQVSK